MIFLFLLLLDSCTPSWGSFPSNCTVEEQHDALVYLYSSWNGPEWHTKTGWLNTALECTLEGTKFPAHCCWHGIKCCTSHTCSEGQRPGVDQCGCEPGLVWEIALSSNSLAGDFSSLNHNVFACELSGMRLSNNKLRGSLGPDFTVYRRLDSVDLMQNSLHGTLPRGIGQISSLSLLFLSHNSLEGTVPSDICGNDTKLFSLAIDDNNFSGRLDLSHCTKLGYIVAKGNNFSEVLHSGNAGMPALKGLFLEENALRGTLPSDMFISFLPSLEQLGLSRNKISGPLPVMSLYSLKYVVLDDNRLTGPVPDSWAIMARPGLQVALHVNFLSCCGTDPLSADELIEAAGTLRIDEVYGGVDYSAPILPPYLEHTEELHDIPVLPGQNFKANGMRCPKIKVAEQGEGPSSTLDWFLDPPYYMFVNCECEEGLQLVNLTTPGRLPYLECQAIALNASDDQSWEEAYPWAIVIIVVVGCALAITLLLGLYLYKGTEVVQRLNNLKKRMHGLPTNGPFTAVVTDIQGWTALCAEHPALSVKVLSIHNALLRRARWNNFGSTENTEGDSFTMVFYCAKDAVAFCLQAQQMLSMQQWPSSYKEGNGQEQSTPLLSSGMNPIGGSFHKSGNNSFPLLNHVSSSKTMKATHSTRRGLDIRVRMGLASGFLCPGEALHGHPTIELAKEVSDAAVGGQILMECSTFAAIKDSLGELGTVDAQGMHLDRMRMRRVFERPAFFLCRFIAPAASKNNEDAIVLDMGAYTKQDQGLKQLGSPPPPPSRARTSKSASRTSRLSIAGTVRKPADPDVLHLYQVLPSCNAECAKIWASSLRLKSDNALKDSLSKGYFDAPGTLAAPLSTSQSSADVILPLVTTVFASVEHARVLSSKDLRLVEQGLLACASHCLDLEQVQGDGYLCRVFGNLKLMLCFSKPEAALAWSCAMQECMMAQPWPRAALKEPFKEMRDQHGNLVFRGPRLKVGISQGQPRSIQPDHLGRADYHGDSINSAARFMEGAAQGGMVVCEQEVAMKAAEAWAAAAAAEQPSSGPEQAIETTLHKVQPPNSWSHLQSTQTFDLVQQQQPQDEQTQDCKQGLPQSAIFPMPKDDDKPGAPAGSNPFPRSEPLCTLRSPLPAYPSTPQSGQRDGVSSNKQCLSNVHVFWLGLFRFKGLAHMKSMVYVLQDKLVPRAAGFAPKSQSPGTASLVFQLQPKGPSMSSYLVSLPVIDCPSDQPEPRRVAPLVRFEVEGSQQGSDNILSRSSISSLKSKLSACSR